MGIIFFCLGAARWAEEGVELFFGVPTFTDVLSILALDTLMVLWIFSFLVWERHGGLKRGSNFFFGVPTFSDVLSILALDMLGALDILFFCLGAARWAEEGVELFFWFPDVLSILALDIFWIFFFCLGVTWFRERGVFFSWFQILLMFYPVWRWICWCAGYSLFLFGSGAVGRRGGRTFFLCPNFF